MTRKQAEKQLKSLKSTSANTNNAIVNQFVVRKENRTTYRVGELQGDWLMHGTLSEVLDRMFSY